MKGFPDLPPIWAAFVAFLAIFAAWFEPIISFGAPRWVSGLCLGAGFALVLWSAYFFWKNKTAIEPHHTPTTLIVEGPYRISRNPIYLGMFLGVFGVALWSGAVSALLVACIFPIIIRARFIRAEEEALKTQFGEAAEIYLASTSRWIFGI